MKMSIKSQFCMKLLEAGADSEIINIYAKNKDVIQESNKIQKKWTKKRMANSNKIPIYFSLARVFKRLQNMDVSKISTRKDLMNMIVILNMMRPAKVRFL